MRTSRGNLDEVFSVLESTDDRAALLELWRQVYDQPPPRSISTGLMKRAIAYRLQEKVLGGLKVTTRRYLLQVVNQTKAKCVKPPEPAIKPGTRLVREWHGRVHEVLIEPDCVLMNGQRFKSLSEAARAITGAHWSGPRFFGLRRAT